MRQTALRLNWSGVKRTRRAPVKDPSGEKQSKSQIAKRYYENNKDRVCLRALSYKRSLSPDKIHGRTLLKFNITVEDYKALLSAQSGHCAICGRPETDNGGKRFAVDHDHTCCPETSKSCGKCVRGLLCGWCNIGLGHFQDSPAVVANAAAYLERYKSENLHSN